MPRKPYRRHRWLDLDTGGKNKWIAFQVKLLRKWMQDKRLASYYQRRYEFSRAPYNVVVRNPRMKPLIQKGRANRAT